jgi:hypothetical protein
MKATTTPKNMTAYQKWVPQRNCACTDGTYLVGHLLDAELLQAAEAVAEGAVAAAAHLAAQSALSDARQAARVRYHHRGACRYAMKIILKRGNIGTFIC